MILEKILIGIIYIFYIFIFPFILFCILDFLVCIIYHKKSIVIRLFKDEL